MSRGVMAFEFAARSRSPCARGGGGDLVPSTKASCSSNRNSAARACGVECLGKRQKPGPVRRRFLRFNLAGDTFASSSYLEAPVKSRRMHAPRTCAP